MKSLGRWSKAVVALAVLMFLPAAAPAVAAEFSGGIDGFEIAIQNLDRGHGAVFVFGFEGTVDGRTRKGWGWIEVVHDDLDDSTGGVTGILYGRGVLWVGLRRYEIEVLPGTLLSDGAGTFSMGVTLSITPRVGPSVSHTFDGVLSHNTFPPTIYGNVEPDVPD